MHPRNLHKTELRNALVAFLTLFCSMRSIGLIDLWGAEKVFIVEMDISSSEWTNIWQRAGLPNSWNLQRSAVQPQRNQIANIFPNLCRRMHLLRSSNIRIRPKAASQPRNSRANCKRDLFFPGTQMHQIFDTTSRCTLVNRLEILRIITTLLGPAFIDY